MNTMKLIEISPSSIDIGPIPFDLFLHRNDSLILFCRKGHPVEARHIDMLENRQAPFYVKKSQWTDYVSYANDSLPMILMDSGLEPVYRSEVMHTLSLKKLSGCFNETITTETILELQELTECFNEYLSANPEAAIHLFKRSESDDPLLQRSINCCTFNVVIAQRLFPDNKDLISELALAGLLHDIGMKEIDSGILNKRGRLDRHEFENVQQHCIQGANLLDQLDMPEGVIRAAMSHHERNDGSGYLEGLKRDDIHPFARVTAVSDVYDALTSNRPYAERKRHIAALAEIREARHLFDRQAVETLIDVVLRNERLIELYNQDKVPVDLSDVEEIAS